MNKFEYRLNPTTFYQWSDAGKEFESFTNYEDDTASRLSNWENPFVRDDMKARLNDHGMIPVNKKHLIDLSTLEMAEVPLGSFSLRYERT